MLRRLSIAGVLLVAALGAGACGSDKVGGASDEEVTTAEAGAVEGEFTISNWPGYIDPGKEGSVAELRELVEFLKEPYAFQAVGARTPNGVLMFGPPGSG